MGSGAVVIAVRMVEVEQTEGVAVASTVEEIPATVRVRPKSWDLPAVLDGGRFPYFAAEMEDEHVGWF